MHINIVTLFPEWFTSPLETALMKRAIDNGLLCVSCINPREHALDAHHTVDDRPYGGGPGMVMMLDPLVKTLHDIQQQTTSTESIPGQTHATRTKSAPKTPRMIMLSASGKPFSQSMARELAKDSSFTLICGRYEGIDARLTECFPIEAVNVGNAVLNGGEAAAMMIIEAVTRLVPGFMGKEASGVDESFSDGLLEYPHYTRPEAYDGYCVPEILRSGDHQRIAAWRRTQSLVTTLERRPDLLPEAPLNHQDIEILREYSLQQTARRLGKNLHCALIHYPVMIDKKKSGATSLTNLDIHDIARSSRTYGLAGMHVVTPLNDQQQILDTLLQHWTIGAGARSNPDRAEALALVHKADSIQDAVETVTRLCGEPPLLLATSAREPHGVMLSMGQVRQWLSVRPVLLLFGTGHGLAQEVLDMCDGVLRPIRWSSDYNHLPVRGAAAILFDRLLGDCDLSEASGIDVSRHEDVC